MSSSSPKFQISKVDFNSSKRSKFKSLIFFVLGITALIYLLNPSWGLFELLPDNLPIFGNLDEAAAVTMLIGALRYFGYDLLKAFSKEVHL